MHLEAGLRLRDKVLTLFSEHSPRWKFITEVIVFWSLVINVSFSTNNWRYSIQIAHFLLVWGRNRFYRQVRHYLPGVFFFKVHCLSAVASCLLGPLPSPQWGRTLISYFSYLALISKDFWLRMDSVTRAALSFGCGCTILEQDFLSCCLF